MIAWSTVTTLIRKQFPKLANCRFREQGQGFGYFLCDWNGRMQCVQYTYTDQHTDEMVAIGICGELMLLGVKA